MSQKVLHAKEPSLLNGFEFRVKVKICIPFTGNVDVSVWVKNSRMGRKARNKQAKTC